ncbi:MAG TPA: sugar ABC transporter substrate-binding protein [Gryllotalpicola sp.]
MKRRQALGALVGIAVLGIALQGCSGNSASNGGGGLDGKGKTLDVMIESQPIYPTQQKQWFSDVSAAFEKQTGAKVTFETYPSPQDELTKIQTSVVSGQGPDIYTLGTTFTPTAYSTGAFTTMDDATWKEVGGKDRFIPATLGISGPDDQHQVGIPFSSRPYVMAYNKDILTQAGISQPPTSWDELTQDAAKVTGNGVYGIAVDYADGYDPWKYIWGMSRTAGNPIVDVTTKKAKIDSPEVMKAYQTYFGWLTQQKVVDPASVGWKGANALAAFADGKAAFLPMTSSTSAATLDKSAVAGKYAYALLPTIPPGQTATTGDPAASILSGDNIVVAKYSKNQDLAFALVKYLTSADSQLSYQKLFGDLPTNVDAAKQFQTNNPAFAPVIDAAGKSYGTPFTGAWSDVQLDLTNVVVQSLPQLARGSLSDDQIESKLKAAQSAAQTSLDKAKG